MTITGTCKYEDLCYESTKLRLDNIQLYEIDTTDDSITLDTYSCHAPTANRNYVPFYQVSNSYTAIYNVDIDSISSSDSNDKSHYIAPSMYLTIPNGGNDLWVEIDMDEVDDHLYAVEFHVSKLDDALNVDYPCIGGNSQIAAGPSNCTQNIDTINILNTDADTAATVTEYNIIPTSNINNTSPQMGDNYEAESIALNQGDYVITPYIYKEGTGTLNFKFSGSIGSRINPGYQNRPSSMLIIAIFILSTVLLYI